MPSENVSVLLVDDEPTYTQMAKDFLEREGEDITVTIQSDPESGLDYALENKDDIDCILCDYKMPIMDGLEFYEEIVSNDIDAPFFILTGRGDESVANAAIQLGVTDYIVKQDDPEQYTALYHRIQKEVHLYRARKISGDLETVYDQTIKNAPDALVVHDGAEVLHVNDKYADLAEANRRHEIIGQKPDSIIEFDERKSNAFNDTDTDLYEWMEGTLHCVNGETKDVSVAGEVVPYYGEEVTRLLIRNKDE